MAKKGRTPIAGRVLGLMTEDRTIFSTSLLNLRFNLALVTTIVATVEVAVLLRPRVAQ